MTYSLQDWLGEQMQDPEFAREYRNTKALYQISSDIIRLRAERKLSQKELATRVGTQQAGISRLETMASPPTLTFLQRIADALDADLEIRLIPRASAMIGADD